MFHYFLLLLHNLHICNLSILCQLFYRRKLYFYQLSILLLLLFISIILIRYIIPNNLFSISISLNISLIHPIPFHSLYFSYLLNTINRSSTNSTIHSFIQISIFTHSKHIHSSYILLLI